MKTAKKVDPRGPVPLMQVEFVEGLNKSSFDKRHDQVLRKTERIKAKSYNELVKIQRELSKLMAAGVSQSALSTLAAQAGIAIDLPRILAADTVEKRMAYLQSEDYAEARRAADSHDAAHP